MSVSIAISCEYEKGIGCERIFVQPWYACDICPRWSSSRIDTRSVMWWLRTSERMIICTHPSTISGRRRTLTRSSFSCTAQAQKARGAR